MPSKIDQLSHHTAPKCGNCRHQFKVYHDLAIGSCHLQSGIRHSIGGDNDTCNIDRFEERQNAPPPWLERTP